MTSSWNKIMKGILLLISIIPFACASSGRYISSPKTLPSDLGISSGNKDLNVSLNYLIIPNGLGSWIKDAQWDEYGLILSNLSAKPIIIEKIRLVDPRGLYIERGRNPWQLEKVSKNLAEEYKTLGIAVAIDVAPGVIAGTSAGAAVLGTGVGAVVLAPVAAVAAPVYLASKRYAKAKDRKKIEEEFYRRQISTLPILSHSTLKGSVFFPIVPNPMKLVIEYEIGNKMKGVEVSLDKLSGLHVAPPGEGKK